MNSPAADLHRQGVAAREAGDIETARVRFQEALRLDPSPAAWWADAADIQFRLEQWEIAGRLFEAALALQPGHPAWTLRLVSALLPQRRLEEMLVLLARVEDVCANQAEFHFLRGVTLLLVEEPAAGELALVRALELDPGMAKAHAWTGATFAARLRLPEAFAACARALDLDPDDEQGRLQRTLLHLSEGNFAAGMEDYERRLVNHPQIFAGPAPDLPLWDGAPFPGKTLLVLAEQGYGDTLQFVRLAREARRRGGRVIVECQPGLERLLAHQDGIDAVFPCGAPRPPCDLYAPLLSLIRLLGLTVESIPPPLPYRIPGLDLDLAPPVPMAWNGEGPLRVGLVWSGSIANTMNRQRSCALERLLPLGRVPGVALIGLQKFGGRGPAAPAVPPPFPDAVAACGDFLDTARVVAALDLVVTVDTAVAHLAATLGKPTWILLPYAACWRWLLERGDTPWYPTARLFRQERPGDWDGLVARVAGALARVRPSRGSARPGSRP